jgi:ketol-acid reductoisomerase
MFSNFKNETYADLFSEQSILCSLLPYASEMIFNKLVDKGIEKELAYFESWYEVKLIADTLMKIGPQKFFDLISPNALLGSKKGKDFLLDSHFQSQLNKLLDNIYSEDFFKEVDKH